MEDYVYKSISNHISVAIQDKCEEAQRYKAFIGIIADSGWGKTSNFKRRVKKDPNTLLRKIDPSMSAKPFYEKVLDSFPRHQNHKGKTLNYMIDKTADLFSQRYKDGLMIIDEAGNFKPTMLQYIREFRDKTKHSCGLIIAGPYDFYDNLERWEDDRVKGVHEMMTRVDEWVQLEGPKLKDFQQVCYANNIRDPALMEEIIGDSKEFRSLGKSIIKYYRELDVTQVEIINA